MGEPAIQVEDPVLHPSGNPLRDKWWRLNNLYHILNKHGKDVLFQCNTIQTILYEEMWFRNNILKSRQHGVTTFVGLYFLDEILFNPDIEAGIVAHREKDAQKIFERKIKYPYRHLAEGMKAERPAIKETNEELVIQHPNNKTSWLYVSVTLRSGTVQYLHISEFGYTCRKHPDKAEEIVTGALQAIHGGEIVFIESTAMGRGGYHHDYCKTDMRLDKEIKGKTRQLSVKERKFFFFPWFRDPENVIMTSVPINTRMQKYFAKLENKGIRLNQRQKYWYVVTEKDLGEKMKSEHPSSPEEAFEATIRGAIFMAELNVAREEGRICDLPIRKDLLVDTWWDLGLRNRQSIWLSQDVGGYIHMLDYYENKNQGILHYVDFLRKWQNEHGVEFHRHYAPHDIGQREWSDNETRWDKAQKKGITFIRVPKVKDKKDSIEAARDMFRVCKFDKQRCDDGLLGLENYRYEYDDHLGIFQDKPFHDENSNTADAYQTMACGHEFRHVIESQALGRVVQPANFVY
jgi:hypothetical protein